MNKVLSLLMAFVFVHVQSWAAVGGPFDNPQDAKNFTGSYAGVLIPQTEVVAGGAVAVDPNRAASIGLFTLAQPDVGPASGALVAFVNGSAFNGTITGIIDPEDNSFNGIVDATATFPVTVFVPQTTQDAAGNTIITQERQEFPVYAQGAVEAEIEFGEDESVSITGTGLASTNFPARISGDAVLEIFFQINADGTPDVITTARYEVDGFKQSDTVTQTTFSFGDQFEVQGPAGGDFGFPFLLF